MDHGTHHARGRWGKHFRHTDGECILTGSRLQRGVRIGRHWLRIHLWKTS